MHPKERRVLYYTVAIIVLYNVVLQISSVFFLLGLLDLFLFTYVLEGFGCFVCCVIVTACLLFLTHYLTCRSVVFHITWVDCAVVG